MSHLNVAHRKPQSPLLWVFVIVALAFSIAGCAEPAPLPTREPLPTLTPKPTFTPVKVTQNQPMSTSLVPPTPITTPTVVPTAQPASTETPMPTETPTSTDTATAIAADAETSAPTVTLAPTQAPTFTSSPAEAPDPTEVSEPTEAPKATAAPASSGGSAAKPKGAPLAYEPEFPPVSPASEPPSYDDHTNPLTGRHVDDASRIRRRPIMVRYGNDRAARPHSGISQAELVMEDVMDAWWITRLTAVYLEHEPDRAGPLRSARPVNVEILPAFDGVLVFSGASIGVNQLLAQHNFDLIHEGLEGDLFYRSSDRGSPHNLYTSIADVRERLRVRGKEHAVDLRAFSFSPDIPISVPGGQATRIDIPLPRTSTVAWTWDAGAGVYRRWVQGDAYTDLATGEQIGAENVIVIYAKHWESDIVEDSLGATSIGIALKGGERVQIFRDGRVLEGTWYRKDANRLFQFIDGNGNHIPLKPGQSWIQFVPTTYQLGIK